MRSRIRALLLFLLLGAILLEALTWIRMPLLEAVHRAYPSVALDRDGNVVCYDFDIEQRADGTSEVIRELDTARNPREILALGPGRALDDLITTGGPSTRGNLDFDYARFLRAYARSREPSFAPYPPLEQMANTLRSIEAKRRGIDPIRTPIGATPRKVPVDWRVENDRIVCRYAATGEVVAGLGPDGYARGAKADEGGRFGAIYTATNTRKPTDTYEWWLLEWDARKLHAVSMPSAQAEEGSLPTDSTEPVSLAIEARPLHPLQGGAPTENMPYAAIVGGRVLVFLGDGSIIAEIVLEEGERVTSTSGVLLVRADVAPEYFGTPMPNLGNVVVRTGFSPVHAGDDRMRLRLFRPGQPEIVRDLALTPTRGGEVFLANLTAAFALLRPPPLALASAVSPLPGDRQAWWWRDPWLAAGNYLGWLLASFALAAFLAWRARRSARERCATVREVRFWTAAVFLLGPVGLLWMRFVLPSVPVEAVLGARRAVNLDASPSTAAPWPDPKPLGIEVIS